MVRQNQSLLDDMLHGAVATLAGVFRAPARLRALARRRGRPASPVEAAAPMADRLAGIGWPELVELVAAAFRREGYLVVERGGRGADGGVDLEMYLGRHRYLVQCKQWQSSRVDLPVVRDLFAAMRAERAVGCFIVSSGGFTDEARSFATGRAIRLVPAESLRRMMAGALGGDEASAVSDPGADIAPACPQCGRAMISRLAGRGESRGLAFWGCSGFPGCRGVRAR